MLRRIVYVGMIVVVIIGIGLFETGQRSVVRAQGDYITLMPNWDKSRENRGIVYVSDEGGKGFELYILDMKTGAGKLLISPPPGSHLVHPTWGPQQLIAFKQCNTQRVCELRIADSSGKNQRWIGKGILPSFNSKLAWTPKGEVAVGVEGPSGISIFAINVQSGAVRDLPTNGLIAEDPAFSGKDTMFFSGKKPGQMWKIFRMVNGKVTILTGADSDSIDSLPAVSRDGRVTFVQSMRDSTSIVYQKQDGSFGQIPHHSFSDTPTDVWADWSPDGKQLVYTSVVGYGKQVVYRLFLYDIATDTTKCITCTEGDLVMPPKPTLQPSPTNQAPTPTLDASTL